MTHLNHWLTAVFCVFFQNRETVFVAPQISKRNFWHKRSFKLIYKFGPFEKVLNTSSCVNNP